jgi:hypothetical protein
MPASPFISSRNPKDGSKKTIDHSHKEGEQGIEKTTNVNAGKNAPATP